MTTLRVVNGDLDVDSDRGVLNTVTGMEEASQNVARHLLTEYSTFFDEGNELLTFALGASPKFFTDIVAVQYLTEAVNRLIIKQRDAELEDRIVKVQQVKTRLVGLTTLVFLVEVLFQSGESLTVVDQSDIRPIQLEHIFNTGTALKV